MPSPNAERRALPGSSAARDTLSPVSETDLETLVADWLTVPDLAEALGLPLSAVRQLITDRELIAHRITERNVIAVPAAFISEGAIRSDLRGTFTVLGDGGMNDEEILRWLFTPEATLPDGVSPMGALQAGHKTEIRRRAAEAAF